MLKVWQDKKPSETSEKTVDSVGVKEDMERGGHVQAARASFKDKTEASL